MSRQKRYILTSSTRGQKLVGRKDPTKDLTIIDCLLTCAHHKPSPSSILQFWREKLAVGLGSVRPIWYCSDVKLNQLQLPWSLLEISVFQVL